MTDTFAQLGFKADPVTQAVTSAPELAQSPGLAVSVAGQVATSQQPDTVAQSAAQAGNRQANADGQIRTAPAGGGSGWFNDVTSFFGNAAHDVAHVGGDILNAANQPLRYVQHEYKYLHDVEALHGYGAALAEGAGMLAGGVAGFAVAGPAGAALGAEGVGALEGQITYHDSWNRTQSANYRDPHTGQLVSFGRDIISMLPIRRGTMPFTDLSGAADGIFDIVTDPLGLAGKIHAGAMGAEGAAGLLGNRFGGTALTAENFDQAYTHYSSVRRAISDIADMDAGQILAKYPKLEPIIGRLGAATTADQVADQFRTIARSQELLKTIPGTLPTLSITRIPLGVLREAAQNYTGPLAENVLFGPGRWARRLEHLPGMSWDPDKMEYVAKSYDPSTNVGIGNVYAMIRYSETREVAENFVSSLVHANVAKRVELYRNAVIDNLLGMAHLPSPDKALYPDLMDYMEELADGRFKQEIMARLKNLTAFGEPGGVYGVHDGHITPDVIFKTDDPIPGMRRFAAGVTANQKGALSVPDFTEAKRMALALRQEKRILGKVMLSGHRTLAALDDFAYDHITQGFFKPLVLQSGGYALHIAAAEAIPNTLRNGFHESVASAYRTVYARLGYRADNEELKGLTGYLWGLLGRLPKNEQDMHYAMEVAGLTRGAMVPDGVAAGENVAQEAMSAGDRAAQGWRVLASKVPRTKTSNDFAMFGDEEKRYTQLWQRWMSEGANDPATRAAAEAYRKAASAGLTEEEGMQDARKAAADYWRSRPQDELDTMLRSQHFDMENPPSGWDEIDNWGLRIAENMQGMVLGRSGRIHIPFVDLISKGKVPDRRLLDNIEPVDRPIMVKGRIVIPDGSSLPQRIAAVGFRKILNPMVNVLSREPLFMQEYLKARRPLQGSVDNGIFSEDEATTIAASQAAQHSMRFVHNLHDRTQWTATMRNYAPFYFAQEQAYRRMGRLLAEDPGAFRRYQMTISSVANIANKQQDSNGNQYIVFPGLGFLSDGVPDLFNAVGVPLGHIAPAQFGGSYSAANVIFPLSQGIRPGMGPVMAFPAQLLADWFPELGKSHPALAPLTNVVTSALTEAVGSTQMSQPVWEQLIPNTFVQRVIETVQGDDNSFNSSFISTLQSLAYEQDQAVAAWRAAGSKGPEPDIIPPADATPQQLQDFLNQVKNQTRIRFAVRALLGLVSPVSADVEIQNWGLPQQLTNAITKAGSVSAGVQAFLAKNPNATPYTTFRSETVGGGPALSDSTEAEQWINSNLQLLHDSPAAIFFMPQLTNNTYSPTVYNEQIAQNLRAKLSPSDFLNNLYVAAGNQLYYPLLAQHEANLTAAGSSSIAKNAEYATWDQTVQRLQTQNPIWANNYYSFNRQEYRQQSIQQLTSLFENNQAPTTGKAGAQADLIAQVLEYYYQTADAYAAAQSSSNYASAQAQIRDGWTAYSDQLAKEYPQLSTVMQSVFRDAFEVTT